MPLYTSVTAVSHDALHVVTSVDSIVVIDCYFVVKSVIYISCHLLLQAYLNVRIEVPEQQLVFLYRLVLHLSLHTVELFMKDMDKL